MKIVTVNIERNNHLKKIIPFLLEENPEVVCLQEVIETSLPEITSALGMHATFAPETILNGWEADARGHVLGIALLTKEPHTLLGIPYYQKEAGTLGTLSEGYSDEVANKNVSRPVILAELHGSTTCYIGVTHFTYTSNGEPSDTQRESLQKLLDILTPYSNILLCGDFNIPRGTELYNKLCGYFTDTIPQKYDSSLDPILHRKPGLKYVVDYIWARGSCTVEAVTLRSGVSDHCAVIGTIVPIPILQNTYVSNSEIASKEC